MKIITAITLLAFLAYVAAAPDQSDRVKVEEYAKDVLLHAKNILTVFPANSPEATELKKIIEHVDFRIGEIKSQGKLNNIVDTVALLALDNEKVGKIFLRLYDPKNADDKMKVLSFAKNLFEHGNEIVTDFPGTVEAGEVKKLLANVQLRIKTIESELEINNIVDTVASLALDGDKLFKLDTRLRRPDHQPQDDKTKVLTYAKNVLKTAETLEKKYPTEKKDIDAIIRSVHFRIETVQSQVYLNNIVDTVAYLVLDNEKLAQIAKKHGDHIFN